MENLAINEVTMINVQTLEKDVLNHPETIIKLSFLAMNLENLSCVIKIDYKGKDQRKFRTIVTTANMTVYAKNWFVNERPCYNEKGELIPDMFLTNFQKYLSKRNLNPETPLGMMEFDCKNHSEEYALNPFSVRFNEKYESATIELVNMPSKRPIIERNPMTGKSEVVAFVYPKRRDNPKRVLRLPKTHYKRVIVK